MYTPKQRRELESMAEEGIQPDLGELETKAIKSGYGENEDEDQEDDYQGEDGQLAGQERAASRGGSTALKTRPKTSVRKENPLGDDDEEEDSWYKGSRAARGRKILTKKRGGIIGAVIVVTGVLGIGLSSVGSLQLIHLSQLFQKDSASQEDNGNARMTRFFRAVKANDIGETRISLLESKVNARFNQQLAEKGMKIDPAKISGQLGTLTIDPAKSPTYADAYNKAVAANDETAKAAVMKQIAIDNGLPYSALDPDALKGGKAVFNMTDQTIAAKRSAIKGFVKTQDYGRIRTALVTRILAKKYNAPGILHPFKKIGATADQKIATVIQNYRDEKAKAVLNDTPDKQSRFKSLRDTLNEKGVTTKVATGALLPAQAICIAKDLTDSVYQSGQDQIVGPAKSEARYLIGEGDQQASGQDVTEGIIAAANDGLVNKDPTDKVNYNTTVFQSASIRNRQGETGGIAMSAGEKATFSPEQTSAAVAGIFSGDSVAGDSITALCSPIGQVVQGVAGITLLVFTVGQGNIATTVIGATTTSIAIAKVISYVKSIVVNNDPIFQSLESKGLGAIGGDLASAGSRAAAGDSYISDGGVAQTSTQEKQTNTTLSLEDKANFDSKSLFARVFDVNDYRSLFGRLSDDLNSSTTASLANVATSFASVGTSALKNIGSIFSPKTYAYDVTPYDYGFPSYGFSEEDMNNPAVQNPYDNAAAASKLLDDGTGDYASEALRCFGVHLTKDSSGKWGANVDPSITPVPSDEKYYGNDCVKSGDTDWLRIRYFIFDTHTMEAYACYENLDDQACANSGAVTTTTTTPTATTTTTTTATSYGATADQNKDLPAACASGTATDSVRMLCVGAKYRDKIPYLYYGNPRNGKLFSEQFAKGDLSNLSGDCSLFVSIALYDAYGIDVISDSGSYVNSTLDGKPIFQKIPLSQAVAGDLAVDPGVHIAIVNVPGSTVLDLNTKHANSPIDDVGVHPMSLTNFQYALHYIGPNATGNTVQVGTNATTTTGPGSTTTTPQNGQGVQLDGVSDLIVDNQFPSTTNIIPKVSNIVIHWLDSNPETPSDAGNALTSDSGASVQFYVSQSGKIMQLTQYANTRAGHAKNANNFSIGIEIGSPTAAANDPAPYNDLQTALMNNTTQKQQVIKLATALAKKFGITSVTVGNQVLYTSSDTCASIGLSFPGTCATQPEASQFGIVGHYQLQNTKSDPGSDYILEIQKGVKANLGL